VKDVDNLNVKGLFSSCHLRSYSEASHSLSSFNCPASSFNMGEEYLKKYMEVEKPSMSWNQLSAFIPQYLSLSAWELTHPSTERKSMKGGSYLS
jgi:hypothetical protein